MLGHQHFALSTATALLVLIPFLPEYRIRIGFVLVGVAIGSLIPDIDSKGTAIFSGNINELDGYISRVFAYLLSPFMPAFGYFTRYFIYKPAVKLLNVASDEYRFEEKHRGFTHSLMGVVVFVLCTGLALYPVFLYFGSMSLLIYLMAGYTAGAVLHMVQDSLTRSGIKWNQPFSSVKLKGQLRTGKDTLRPQTFLATLISLILLGIAPIRLTVFSYKGWNGLVLAGLCWLIFALISGIRISTE